MTNALEARSFATVDAAVLRTRSRADFVYESLRDAISEGRIAKGERVPEEEVARNLGVSRTPVREALQRLRDEGCHLFLWSSVGVDYARKVAAFHGLTELFEGYASKPDIIIDDMPGTALNPFVFDVNAESSWPSLADKIISKHID